MAKEILDTEYQKKKQSLQYAYLIVIYNADKIERYFYGRYKSARRFYNFVKQYGKYDSIKFYYKCTRFDNSGCFRVGFGESRSQAKFDSYIDFDYMVNFPNVENILHEKND